MPDFDGVSGPDYGRIGSGEQCHTPVKHEPGERDRDQPQLGQPLPLVLLRVGQRQAERRPADLGHPATKSTTAAATIPTNDSMPAAVATEATASTNYNSYANSWAGRRASPHARRSKVISP